MADHEVTEAETTAAVRAAFGHEDEIPIRASAVEAFMEAGFVREDAERGARMLESGPYFGFEDVATTLVLLSQSSQSPRHFRVSNKSISEAAKRYEKRIQEQA